ncbi:MAG: precorrin-6y C5,15-methyltransferase (decarboxylating) subunit CbiE [Caldilinea sp.]|nr:precorrin-6y C5,15-methyltransferase (decarboxylating) subunit CbiE [Caldilinea sp.]MDW8441572.1 precorrin-6y C5,15-methyltransferase (decarboxylating) subunit CbiE [Caldilineaceae bacterium]
MKRTPILVVGIHAGGPQMLPPTLRDRIEAAQVLIGGKRHLAYFPTFTGETVLIAADVGAAVERARQGWEAGERVAVLASGDPLWYGVGATLRKALPPEALEIHPAPASFQLAFAALAEPWHDAALLSAHGRPLSEILHHVFAAPKAAILTDRMQTPAVVARALLVAGLNADAACAVCENLGAGDRRVLRMTLAEVARREDFAPLNVFIVWNPRPRLSRPPGLPDEAFITLGGQITKREIRLLSLAELALGADEVLWDIGAGSGAVAIEAAAGQPTARVYAVERRPEFCACIRQNLSRLDTPNVQVVEGNAPEVCRDLPDPDAVFIGGSGGRLTELVGVAQERLHPGGRLVINVVTLDHLETLRRMAPTAQVTLAQIGRGKAIQSSLRLEALNPVFMFTWRKPA